MRLQFIVLIDGDVFLFEFDFGTILFFWEIISVLQWMVNRCQQYSAASRDAVKYYDIENMHGYCEYRL